MASRFVPPPPCPLLAPCSFNGWLSYLQHNQPLPCSPFFMIVDTLALLCLCGGSFLLPLPLSLSFFSRAYLTLSRLQGIMHVFVWFSRIGVHICHCCSLLQGVFVIAVLSCNLPLPQFIFGIFSWPLHGWRSTWWRWAWLFFLTTFGQVRSLLPLSQDFNGRA